ncbi:hypothetical protein [Taklimakanibacter albus]|uniref:Uncharacterized protein n=1 Tax=Taklimakanibacter albus TaxID=2800327 RepID=A0ACC5R9X8_9HYPH|nr:hypothetical protein [Aestuariivirga sp. YIM B02566]MBK1869480.1 hypothetical protein [Aestuariivirga sp. YIM B02566]
MMRLSRPSAWVGIALAALLLGACSSSSTRIDDSTGPDVTAPPPTVPTGPMKAGEIMRVLSGNSFRYTRTGSRTGTTTFNSDGTFSYQESGKGEGTGIWQASDGSLCEAFNPTSFLPRGTRTECSPFSQTAQGGYKAGGTVFEPM